MSIAYPFCPMCGTKYLQPILGNAQYCTACTKTFFHNQFSTACGVLIRDGKILLTQRARNPLAGHWDLPGGFVEPREHPTEAVVRELFEELNIHVRVDSLLEVVAPVTYEYEGIEHANCDHIYLITCEDFSPMRPQDDVAAAQFFALEDLPPAEHLAFASTTWAVEWFKKLERGDSR